MTPTGFFRSLSAFSYFPRLSRSFPSAFIAVKRPLDCLRIDVASFRWSANRRSCEPSYTRSPSPCSTAPLGANTSSDSTSHLMGIGVKTSQQTDSVEVFIYQTPSLFGATITQTSTSLDTSRGVANCLTLWTLEFRGFCWDAVRMLDNFSFSESEVVLVKTPMPVAPIAPHAPVNALSATVRPADLKQ